MTERLPVKNLPQPMKKERVTAPLDEQSTLARQLEALAGQDTKALKKLFERCHGRRVPSALSRDLLIRMIAYRLQERALGGLSAAMKRKLKLLGEQLEAGTLKGASGVISLKPGTKLIRSWHEKTYEVLVLEEGFEMEGERYSSLSAIAKAITGSHWSGPRFFGLTPKKVPRKVLGTGAQGKSAETGAPAVQDV